MANNPDPPLSNSSVLPLALEAVEPLVLWLVRSGVGYTEFSSAIKRIFFMVALAEGKRISGKDTDSMLSLLSGLHRKDIRLMREKINENEASRKGISPASQVVSLWVHKKWSKTIPFSGKRKNLKSFVNLTKLVSLDLHPRSIVEELVRLGLVLEGEGTVTLQKSVFVPDTQSQTARQMFADSVSDHIASGVHNLTKPNGHTFLEQSFFADGLHPESIRVMAELANSLWQMVSEKSYDKASALVDRDEASGGQHRMRLGMYFYSELIPKKEGSS
ncbi:MAG: DUF6502 family protein [Gammaproteobacteria bacterium]|nr:DUF6502 family protein [Gammaproteobacteria bacterium]